MAQLVQIDEGSLPTLVCFGADAKFDRWRKMQESAILAADNSDRRFVLQVAPTGFGKSPVYVGHALLSGARTVILTATKGLQAQLVDDFASIGLVDIRGMNSYPCHQADSEFGVRSNHVISCDEGPCKSGLKCSIRESGCSYYDAYREAQTAQLVVTNYAYWMTINRYGEGLGHFDLMVCDEGHDAPEELSGFLEIELEPSEIEGVIKSTPMRDGVKIDDWKQWAVHHAGRMQAELDRTRSQIKERHEIGKVDYGTLRAASQMNRVLGKLKSLASMKGEWVVEQVTGERGGKRRWRFDPVQPAEYAEQVLFRATPKVVVYSATIRKKTASLLGIPASSYDFNEWPSTFPIARRMVTHVATAQMSHRTSPEALVTWQTRIDQIIQNRLDRKGVIHTTSFKLRNAIMQNSNHTEIMYANDSSNTRAVIDRFKKADAPAVLVSPSVTTGFDFPFDQCRYIIIAKIPFIDTRPAIVQARLKRDKEYANYVTAQTLVQMAGRGMRAENDICEVLIVDDNWAWFWWYNRHLFPQWFNDAVRKSATIPKPPQLVVA